MSGGSSGGGSGNRVDARQTGSVEAMSGGSGGAREKVSTQHMEGGGRVLFLSRSFSRIF